MNRRFVVGQLVVCKKVIDDRYTYLVGAVGEIKMVLPGLITLLSGHDYTVAFPAFTSTPCPGCGKVHDHVAMADEELKPLDDPDEDAEDTSDEELPENIGFPA